MDTTDFSNRQNAKRRAEKMISAGTAPAIDYGITERDDGRFEIVWKTAAKAPSTDEVETEIAEAVEQAEASWSSEQPEAEGHPAADTRESSDPANGAAESEEAITAPPPPPAAPIGAESEPDPFPVGSEVQLRARTVVQVLESYGDGRWAVHAILTAADLVRPAERKARTPKPAGEPRRSKSADLDEAAARGVVPTKPDVTSHANHHYQKRFDRLAELAAAGDWDAVADYQCGGINSYAKQVRQYRDRLVAAHKAQQPVTEQGAVE